MERERYLSIIIEHLLRVIGDRLSTPAERLCVTSAVFAITAKADGMDRANAIEAASMAFETVPDLPQEPQR